MLDVFAVPPRIANDGPKPKSLAERFWRRVIQSEDGCWGWRGSTTAKGYGKLGTYDGGWVHIHRVSWEIHYGPIPEDSEDQYVLHSCDNPPCSRPDHLFLGTQADNLADMAEKGRSCLGSLNMRSKLIEQQVILIRDIYATGKFTQEQIAEEFGISRPNISLIVNGVTWRHILEMK